MASNYSELTQLSKVDSLKSAKNDFLIFKHSTQCSISLSAFGEFKDFLATNPSLECYYVDVIKDRPVSQHIAAVFDVQHESPQVLVVKNGSVIFSCSHRAISREKLTEVCEFK